MSKYLYLAISVHFMPQSLELNETITFLSLNTANMKRNQRPENLNKYISLIK